MDLRGRRRRRASVRSIKWDEHGAGLFWGSRGRSRHEGDPRPRAQQRSDRQSDCARFASILGASRSRGGGRSTACSRARARCSGGCGARREGPRGGSSHLALRRAGRGARREATMAKGPANQPSKRAKIGSRLVDGHGFGTFLDFSIKRERLRHYSNSRSRGARGWLSWRRRRGVEA